MTDQIIVYGTTWCGDSRRAKRLFDDNNISYQWVDIDQDQSARLIVEGLNRGNRSVPTIIFPDGSILVEPSTTKLAEKLGIEPPAALF
ncbi:MAG: glutaredoxin domain-containing protein [Leptolinea sp.]